MKSIDVSPAKRNIMASLARNAIAMKITPMTIYYHILWMFDLFLGTFSGSVCKGHLGTVHKEPIFWFHSFCFPESSVARMSPTRYKTSCSLFSIFFLDLWYSPRNGRAWQNGDITYGGNGVRLQWENQYMKLAWFLFQCFFYRARFCQRASIQYILFFTCFVITL